MNKIIKSVAALGLITASSIACAQWSFSAGYGNFSDDGDGIDISVGVVYASAAFDIENGDFTFSPELRAGFGINDDTVFGVNVEVDNFIAASFRGQYNINEGFGVFLQPSYGRLAVTASGFGESESDSDWEFGFGGGAELKLSETASIEALYEQFDKTDVLSVGVRFKF